jgi:hypothetical protein
LATRYRIAGEFGHRRERDFGDFGRVEFAFAEVKVMISWIRDL